MFGVVDNSSPEERSSILFYGFDVDLHANHKILRRDWTVACYVCSI